MDGDRESTSRKDERHALIIPLNLQSHFQAILRHALDVASRGVIITLVAREAEIRSLQTYDEVRKASFSLLCYEDFMPFDSSGRKTEVEGGFSFIPAARNLFSPILVQLKADQKAGLPVPTCIIADCLLGWAPEIAKELNIRSYQFFSCGATFARVLQAYPQLVEDGTLQLIADSRGVRSLAEFEGHLNIPGVPPLQFRDMMNARIMGAGFLISLGRAMAEADGLIINTFYELEAPEIDAIRQSWDEDHRGNIRKLFLYGPVSSGTTFKDPSVLAKSDNTESECIQWLDNQPPQSVVYICFGGLVRLNPAQLRELALALEASGHGFLWVSPRAPPNEAPFKLEDILPPNFLTKVQGRGLTVQGWVPQLEILAHSSTAGFLTHCGWNSIIESINAGVPMIAWPQVPVDQPLNCRHVVDVLEIAVEVELTAKTLTGYNVGRRESSVSISTLSAGHVELEKALRLLMSEEGKAMRARVQELRMKAKSAVADGGPSKAALDELVDSIPTGLSSSLQHSHLKEDFAACQITV